MISGFLDPPGPLLGWPLLEWGSTVREKSQKILRFHVPRGTNGWGGRIKTTNKLLIARGGEGKRHCVCVCFSQLPASIT